MKNYEIQRADFLKFANGFNPLLAKQHDGALNALPENFSYQLLLDKAAKIADPDLQRLCYEYLPLTFSRRHGDPSRPWNKFTIDVKAADGSDNLYYAGNWRDIFQNWEALAYSYPEFTESIIAKFVNASTADGYNPYRITRDGIDWEKVEPDDPWSFIGYWGDHQIIYLQKLLEVSHRHHPGRLADMLSQPIFAYANVPYRIKPYAELLKDPYDTVIFDNVLELEIEERVTKMGADGKLLPNREGSVYRVNLAEKLLVPVLAKFSNFIPEGGIWLNTQRPEWNDANNALVGNGVSMVTLYYMRRFQTFCKSLFENARQASFELSDEVAQMLADITGAFEQQVGKLKKTLSDTDRKLMVDSLGIAGSDYRNAIYSKGFSGKKIQVSREDLLRFFERSLQFIDHSIRANRREDGLYHAYNLMSVNENAVSVSHLYEMLEGQVAVLSSGYLSAEESLAVLQALRHSSMYREDQHSYILYPDRQLPRFLEKNNIPVADAKDSTLIAKLLEDGNRHLVEQDVFGKCHFNGSIRNANDVKDILRKLKENGYAKLVEQEEKYLLDVFEKMFDHQSFTGRSGTFYGYEGLGSIYWHMVSKLLLAAGENYIWARERGTDPATLGQLAACYYDVRAGIGFNKTPKEYGAFPSDPYSHTPGHAGAQQPGMTGQVKEDVLARFVELGVFVENGKINFQPWLLRSEEFLSEPGEFRYFDIAGVERQTDLAAGTLAFTYCQVLVVFHSNGKSGIRLTHKSGDEAWQQGFELGTEASAEIFRRSGFITRIDVYLKDMNG